ncbi:ECF RNA polymerase sigma factor SigW [Kordia sp. SMS9]|uniref:RNA polymerase sigma factor n=1 Tax=Kordia sp. SMS9 TaxID=2282170 RepID=UPI000E0D3183|nr:RNA polymerase sigma factor [Kordia sp. SMS9]AXG68933.1 ECF RNA polymerase sigma factor SigW [Kordia sp. SMS9]
MTSEDKSVCESKHYESIFNTHAETLRNFVYYKCGSEQQAEDIVQEAFIKLWKNCAKIVFTKAKSYLFTVANNMFLNEVAHQKVVLKYKQQTKSKVSNETPEFILRQKEFQKKLQHTLAKLPDGQREVFLLNRIDKKTYAEIAEILGLSVKAIEKRMHKALVTLRKEIGNV